MQKSMIKLLSVADLITLLNAVLGFLALLLVFSDQFHLAAALIFLGLLADGLDGIIARRLGNSSVGEHLESIADLISLSIAPLALFFKVYYEVVFSQQYLYLFVGSVIIFSLVCSIIRLSSFSLLKDKEFFIGLPTSVSAIVLVLLAVLTPNIWSGLLIILVLSLMMISSIHFPKLPVIGNLIAAVLIIATILLDNLYYNITPWSLFVILFFYIIFGPLYLHLKKRK